MEEFDEFRNELEGISPVLSRLPRVNSFKVEDNYFEELPMVVMDRIHARKQRRGIDWSWLLQPKWSVAMAVCMIAVIFGSFLLVRNINTDKPMPVAQVQQLLAEPLSDESVIENVSTDDLVEALANAESTPTDAQKKKAADKKELENYIIDNVDESSIIDAL